MLVWKVGSTLGNTLVDMYAKCSSLEDAYNTFDNLFLKDIVSWNTMIGGYVDNGYNCRALELSERLEKESIMLGLDEFGNAFVDMYAKCDDLEKAQLVFDELPIQDLVSWNSLISRYAQHGHNEGALKCFK